MNRKDVIYRAEMSGAVLGDDGLLRWQFGTTLTIEEYAERLKDVKPSAEFDGVPNLNPDNAF